MKPLSSAAAEGRGRHSWLPSERCPDSHHSLLAAEQTPGLTPRSLAAGLAASTAVLRNSKVFNRTISLNFEYQKLEASISHELVQNKHVPICSRNNASETQILPPQSDSQGHAYYLGTSRINFTNCYQQATSYSSDLRSPPVSAVLLTYSQVIKQRKLEFGLCSLDSSLVPGICDNSILWISGIL